MSEIDHIGMKVIFKLMDAFDDIRYSAHKLTEDEVKILKFIFSEMQRSINRMRDE